jgi:hypothetical protein
MEISQETSVVACHECYGAYAGRPSSDPRVNDFWVGFVRASELEGADYEIRVGAPEECEVGYH